jgi:hypothetical protein
MWKKVLGFSTLNSSFNLANLRFESSYHYYAMVGPWQLQHMLVEYLIKIWIVHWNK